MKRAEALAAVRAIEGIRRFLQDDARNHRQERDELPERERDLNSRVLPLRRALADLTPPSKVTVDGKPIARLTRTELYMRCSVHDAIQEARFIVMHLPRPMKKLRGLVTLLETGHYVGFTSESGVYAPTFRIDEELGHDPLVLESPELFTCTDEDTVFHRGIEIAVLRVEDTPYCRYVAVNNCADRRADDAPRAGHTSRYLVRCAALERQRKRIDNVWRRGAPREPVPGLRRPLPRTIGDGWILGKSGG